MSYYKQSKKEVLDLLNTDENGLSESEAGKRLEKYGYNEIKKEKKYTGLKIFVNQFKNPLTLLLVVAAVLSIVTSQLKSEDPNSYLESLAIFIIILINATLGFVQEYKAEKAVEALEKMSAPQAKVIRNGKEIKILARELVPGDIVVLEEGDIVPADMRLIEITSLQIDESSLTGESVPSKKIIETIREVISATEQKNMAFTSTIVTYGKGKGIVTTTGMDSEIGKIAKSIQETKEVQTPLQIKFAQMAKDIGFIVIILVLIVFIAGVIKGKATMINMFLFSISLAIAAVPNALPVIVTVGLSFGTKRLAKKNMLIKKLHAAESLGSVTIICSDKTGTLTKNEMTVTRIFAEKNIIDITGSGYNPTGDFIINNKKINPDKIELLLRAGYLCNSSRLVEKDNHFSIIGDPTEGSLKVLSKKAGLNETYFKNHFYFLEELPFDSNRKMMSVVCKNRLNNKTEAYVKGAPEILLKKCKNIIENGRIRKLTPKDSKLILETNKSFAENALRILAIAYRDVTQLKNYDIDSVEKGLTFIGLVGMIDPPREEVKYSIQQCNEAGIKVMMITGDHAETAKAVAKQIGLFDKGDLILTGQDIENMDDKELENKIEQVRIIARALPIQKLRIVDALKTNGHIVAMTGDGVNDAPALKKADIGIAMGITGTDVAKEVSKAVLVDDNFATIVNAINEGRNIYDKMIKSARYLLSCNSGEIFSVFIAIMLNFPLPMIPLQILLMNILTDALPALGLGFEPSDEKVMKRSPRDPKINPISKDILLTIIVFGIIMSIGTLFMFSQYKDTNLNLARTVAFTTLVMFEMFAVISSRSLHHSWKELNPFTNLWLIGAVILSIAIQAAVVYLGPLQLVFETVPLGFADILKILGVSFLGFVMMEIGKSFIKISKFGSNNNNKTGGYAS